ncbi:hypothetical protein [Chamaesiphon sp.]|uniref:hypothetical protein n=1 Tax=Chamaesiphon sp. TaxID=2814140 RepID=UPI00359387BC
MRDDADRGFDSLAMPDDCQRCLDAGADRYVAKPVKLSQLVATIETLLNRSMADSN